MSGRGRLWPEASLWGNLAGILTFYGQLTKVNVFKSFELISFPKRNPTVILLLLWMFKSACRLSQSRVWPAAGHVSPSRLPSAPCSQNGAPP